MFYTSFLLWRQGEERLSPERLGVRGIFRPTQVQELWQAFLAGRREVSWSRLWILVVLEDWLARHDVSA